jgi:2-oxoisovalerate dehydrogenase E2 component (dihydrolipoyl transacylase)
MTAFALPDLGEGLQEAEIVAWHVAEGDHVVADQPLVSVETEKAVVEVPSPRAGRIARLLAKVHDHVKVGAALVDSRKAPMPIPARSSASSGLRRHHPRRRPPPRRALPAGLHRRSARLRASTASISAESKATAPAAPLRARTWSAPPLLPLLRASRSPA